MPKTVHLFANWKMYLNYDESNILANALAQKAEKLPKTVKLAVFPGSLSFYPVMLALRDAGVRVGPQNAYWVDKGGYTGENSLHMYKDAGCDMALIGHSERRHIFHESNHDVRQKLETALGLSITPVVCVGETQEERQAGKTEEVVEVQLRAAFEGLSVNNETEIFIAYEPVWAIGTGDACPATDAERMHSEILKTVKTLLPKANFKILYGGSVRPENVADYLMGPNTDGVLIGNASAKLESYSDIIDRASELA